LALVLLLLGVTIGHVHAHGHTPDCTLCQAVPHPELLDVVSLLEAPQSTAPAAVAIAADVDLTLSEVASSISFRGPPA
jgi:hypothetical protein